MTAAHEDRRRPRSAERARRFTTISGRPIERALHAADDRGASTTRATSTIPARFRTRAASIATGYRGKLWTMRQFAGFGTPEDTNARYKALLAAGGTGLSVAFDLPTLMGRDPDHELSLGEVGKCGVNVTSLADMETLFDGIPLGDITTSMTINSPAAMIFAMYLVVAEQQGADWQTLSGTIQNDILKEFIAQKEYIFPPRPSMRLITDIFAFCAERGAAVEHDLGERLSHPRSGRDGGCRSWRSRCATASSTCSGASTPGSTSTTFVPRMSFFFNAHSDFFEEIAKYRAARRIWARGDARPVRREERALVEAALPQPDRRRLADRAAALQQRRAHGAAGAVGGARRHQLAAHQLARRGAGAADRGSRDARAADAADHRARERRRQRRRSARRLVLRREADAATWRTARSPTSTRSTAWAAWSRRSSAASRRRRSPRARTASSRRSSARRRSSSASTTSCRRTSRRSRSCTSTSRRPTRSWRKLERAASGRATTTRVRAGARRAARTRARTRRTLMPPILDAVRAYATVGEMCDALREVWGEYEETPII